MNRKQRLPDPPLPSYRVLSRYSVLGSCESPSRTCLPWFGARRRRVFEDRCACAPWRWSIRHYSRSDRHRDFGGGVWFFLLWFVCVWCFFLWFTQPRCFVFFG